MACHASKSFAMQVMHRTARGFADELKRQVGAELDRLANQVCNISVPQGCTVCTALYVAGHISQCQRHASMYLQACQSNKLVFDMYTSQGRVVYIIPCLMTCLAP